jgi:8-oxo-dGTP pyrophosphatase MutT (NUDIX family)
MTPGTLGYLQAVDAYLPGDKADLDFQTRTSALLRTTANPLHRSQYSPGHITSSALVLSADGRSVLLIWHGKLQRWLQPGGHVESDPDPFQAAVRETVEETGIAAAFLRVIGRDLLDIDIHAIPATSKEPGHDHFDLRVLLVSETKKIVAASDAADARWFDVSAAETSQMLDVSGQRLLRKGLQAFRQA